MSDCSVLMSDMMDLSLSNILKGGNLSFLPVDVVDVVEYFGVAGKYVF